mmetsp:Transcript_88213/g.230096  ORF Transcript_88213/g.230096 Transcript_88213/m.230096 type:complete len:100 (-) Transcript_88213:56-355(-)
MVLALQQCAANPESLQLAIQNGQETQIAHPIQVPFVVLSELPSYNLYGSPLKDTLCGELTDRPELPRPTSCGIASVVSTRLRRLRGHGSRGQGGKVTLV